MPRTAVIVVVSDDERQREDLRADLVHRFGEDYAVVGCDSPTATDGVRELIGEASTAAAVIAAVNLPATARTGVELLRTVRSEHLTARRILLVGRGEWRDHPVRQAMVLGEVDSYLFVPWWPRERWLYQPMSEYLAEWSRMQRPERVAVTVVGAPLDEDSHHLRDFFTRGGLPYDFLPRPPTPGARCSTPRATDGSGCRSCASTPGWSWCGRRTPTSSTCSASAPRPWSWNATS